MKLHRQLGIARHSAVFVEYAHAHRRHVVALPVELHAEGDIALAGTDTVTAEGGMCGTYVRSLGRAGRGTLRIKAAGMDEVSIDFTVTTGETAYV